MEKVLLKMARQLNAYDEATLMSMWDKFAKQVQQFEPTRRWEEAVLAFGFIQALRWKNQLFNYHWAAESRPKAEQGPGLAPPSLMEELLEPLEGGKEEESDGGSSRENLGNRAKVLSFRPREDDEPS